MTTPAFRIEVNGGALSDEIQRRLLSLRLHDEAGFSNDRIEIIVDNRPPWISLPSKGDVFTVYMGNPTMRQMGTFEFDEVVASGGAGHQVSIVAHAKDTGSGFKASQNSTYHGQTIGDIVGLIGGRQGMGVQVDGSLSGIKIDHLDQTNQSDMGFLTDLAKKNNAIMKVINQKIYFAPRDSTKSQDGDVASVSIAYTQGMRYSYISQGRGNYTGVKARYFDKAKAKELFMGAGDVNGVAHTIHELYATKEEAQKAAESLNTTFQRSRETFEVTIPGNPDCMAESPFGISGFPGFIPTTWTADKTEHYMTSKGGYTTTVVGVTPGTDNSGGGGGGDGQEEKPDNHDAGDDGHTVTESVDDDSGGGGGGANV